MVVRVRLFTRYFLSMLIPVSVLVVVGFLSVFYTRRETRRELERLHDGIVVQVEQAVESFIAELDATGVAISSSSDLLVDLREAFDERMTDYSGFETIRLIQSVINPSVYARPALHSLYVYFDDFPEAILTSEFDVVPEDQIPDFGWLDTYRAMSGSTEMHVERRQYRPLVNTAMGSEQVITIYRRIFPLARPSMRGVVVLNISVPELESLVRSMQTHSGQMLSIQAPDGRFLFGEPPGYPGRYQASAKTADAGWRYTLYTPSEVFLQPSDTVFRISVAIVIAASAIGVIVALYLTRRHFAHIQNVLEIVERADAGGELPNLDEHSRTGFSYVTYQILRTVMEKKYLEIELSERELREKTLELLFLRSQLNPHFLFNTLEVINWKVLDHTKVPSEINTMISRLSAILKYSLRAPSRYVPLSDEIENCRNYLTLQKSRYGDRLNYRCNVEPDVLYATVIPMVLQPLVENAIYHGIRELPEGGEVAVSAYRSGEHLQLRVSDSGNGVSEAELVALRAALSDRNTISTGHVGIANSHRRLVLAFGNDARLQLNNGADRGFVVTVHLPLVPYDDGLARRYSDGETP